MTTSNNIKIKEIKNTLNIPIESVFSKDSMQFVYLKNGNEYIKKEIITGESSEEFIEVKQGLKEKQQVSFLAPDQSEELKIKYLKK